MMRIIAILFVAAVAVSFGVLGPLRGQGGEIKTVADTKGTKAAVPEGQYENFNVLQQIRLGATSLVNPVIANGATVVNSYSAPVLFTKTGDSQSSVESSLTLSEAVVAKRTSDGRYQTLPPDESKQILQRFITDPASVEGGSDITILTQDALPKIDSDKLIRWPAENQSNAASSQENNQ